MAQLVELRGPPVSTSASVAGLNSVERAAPTRNRDGVGNVGRSKENRKTGRVQIIAAVEVTTDNDHCERHEVQWGLTTILLCPQDSQEVLPT